MNALSKAIGHPTPTSCTSSCQPEAPQSARSAGYRLTAHHRPYHRRPSVPLPVVCVCYGPTGRGTRTGH
eukprot:4436715-Prymnesium_polylepis.1